MCLDRLFWLACHLVGREFYSCGILTEGAALVRHLFLYTMLIPLSVFLFQLIRP